MPRIKHLLIYLIIISCSQPNAASSWDENIDRKAFEDKWWEISLEDPPVCFLLDSNCHEIVQYQDNGNCILHTLEDGSIFDSCYSLEGSWAFEEPNVYFWGGKEFAINSNGESCWDITYKGVIQETVCECHDSSLDLSFSPLGIE